MRATDPAQSPDATKAGAGRSARLAIREGRSRGPTAGLAPGYVQGNVVIVPAAYADDFALYCERNPRPCPLLATSRAGDPALPALGEDIDIRQDVPRYRVFRDGALAEERTDIVELWREDLVAFVLGCSFSFEEALMAEGLDVRHIALGSNVPMYRTSIDTEPAGPFAGKLVVSMRPFGPAEAIRAITITGRFPSVHGAPIHSGEPAAIGIADIGRPDFGDPVPLAAGEVPLFWACGVTPQVAIERARPPISITHAPGHMLVTDRLNADLAIKP